jgi:rfaE bifunctional protein kinase chain/domain/rfaE bifunctional protein nucleotidyltransferase chain/domain
MKKKILTDKNLLKINSLIKRNKKKVGLCHGVFDLLHPGHIYYFQEAKKKCDILIVSVTADKYVLKGSGKPYFKEKHRMHALSSLEFIDYVILSEEKSAVNIIKKIKPDYYIKGSDYKNSKKDLTGKIHLEKKEVQKHGGKIIFTTGPIFSSSKIINNEFFYNHQQNQFLSKLKKKYNIDTILKFIDKLNTNIPLVTGETIIDEYIFCKAIGKSGKEPYMVMQEKKSEKYLGGVLSISQNLASISNKVHLLTALGSIDDHKKKITKELRKNISLQYVLKKNLPTIVKKRFIEQVDNNKLLGIYNVMDDKDSINNENLLIKKFNKLAARSDLIIIADYGHGFFTKKFREVILKKNKFTALNAQVNAFSIGYHTIAGYKKADLVLMNETELRQELRDKSSERIQLIKKLEKTIKTKYIAITHGKTGATIFSTKNKELVTVPAFAREVIDKVGAGDALFPVLASCLKSKLPIDISLFLASISAAINAENYATKSLLNKVYFQKYLEHSFK